VAIEGRQPGKDPMPSRWLQPPLSVFVSRWMPPTLAEPWVLDRDPRRPPLEGGIAAPSNCPPRVVEHIDAPTRARVAPGPP